MREIQTTTQPSKGKKIRVSVNLLVFYLRLSSQNLSNSDQCDEIKGLTVTLIRSLDLNNPISFKKSLSQWSGEPEIKDFYTIWSSMYIKKFI
jgi:hypothetical protein